jgi:FAD dependent oxidoreductase
VAGDINDRTKDPRFRPAREMSDEMVGEMVTVDTAHRRRPTVRAQPLWRTPVVCPPAPVIDRPTPAPTRTLVVDTVVVGGGPLGTTTAWLLARRGRRVVLAERSTPTHLWRSAGPHDWTAGADLAAAGLWRELERTTGAALLQRPGPRVRADEASAALTAAAIGAGVLLRSGDSVRAVEVVDDGVRVRTRGCVTTARRVVLVGCGPQALAPGLPRPELAERTGPLVVVRGARSFAVPLLAAAVAELAS